MATTLVVFLRSSYAATLILDYTIKIPYLCELVGLLLFHGMRLNLVAAADYRRFMSEITLILGQVESNGGAATEKLLPLVYEELRKLADLRLAQERPGQTLQATALVHEAWLRLVKCNQDVQWQSKGHFFSAAAEAMRRILIERARQKQAQKRGGQRRHLPLDDFVVPLSQAPIDELLDLDEAISRLEKVDVSCGKMVKLRVFAGLSVEEAATTLNISVRTAYRTWALAKAWLYRDLNPNVSS